jgi:hypothetical protein
MARSIIESNSGKFGLLQGSGPQSFAASEIILSGNTTTFERMKLFDFPRKPVDMQSVGHQR